MASVPARRLEAPDHASGLRRRLADERAALRREYEADADASRFLRRHRQAVEASLRELWRESHLPRQLALVAVGGFGRGELYPHSDVDVLVLLPHALDPTGIAQVEQFIGRLWDVGLELGHSVRTVE